MGAGARKTSTSWSEKMNLQGLLAVRMAIIEMINESRSESICPASVIIASESARIPPKQGLFFSVQRRINL